MAEWRTPVFDRTMDDVKSVDRTSAAYQKGALNADDLNRIEDNYKYLMAKLKSDAIFIPHRLRNFTETVLEYVQTGEAGPEYTLVEYLESTGEQFIDTGYRPTSDNLRVVIHFKYTQSHSGLSLFGNHTSAPYAVGVYGSKPQFYVGSGSSGIDCGPTTSLNTRYELDISVKNGTLTAIWNGVTYTAAYSGSLYKDLPFYIFGSNSNGTLGENDNGYLLYKIQFYDNDVLVRDFIPVIDANGEACLYDQLNNEYYYNAGTGSFHSVKPVELPDGYTQVEYIQSSGGTQYIDTGFKPNQNTRVIIDCDIVSYVTNNILVYGCRKAKGSNGFYVGATSTAISFGYGNQHLTSNGSLLGRKVIDHNKSILSVNGEAVFTSTAETFQTEYNLYLFAANSAGTADSQRADVKVYSCKIYDNGTLVRNFVPCTNTSGEAGLYDMINGSFYANVESSEFAVGAEVALINIETEPTYELVETQTTYTDWQENNLPWLSEINRIRANYNALVRLFLVGVGFATSAESNYLDYREVNNWENIALCSKIMFENMAKEYRYCGMENSGGERLL